MNTNIQKSIQQSCILRTEAVRGVLARGVLRHSGPNSKQGALRFRTDNDDLF
jgi:hypothetical protein